MPNVEARLKGISVEQVGQKKLVCHNKQPVGEFTDWYGNTIDLNAVHGMPYDLLDKICTRSEPINKISTTINKKLLAQCKCDGDIYMEEKFLEHCRTNHQGMITKGTIYNVPGLRFNTLRYDDDEYFNLLCKE